VFNDAAGVAVSDFPEALVLDVVIELRQLLLGFWCEDDRA
jgi:hypothetical protein